MKSSKELQAERLELLAEVDALAKLLEGEEARELTDEEQARFDELTAEESGEIAQLDGKIAKASQREKAVADARRRIVESGGEGQPSNGGPRKERSDAEPKVDLKGQKSKAFKDPRDAYLSGCWLQAACASKIEKPGVAENARKELARFGWGEYATMTEGTGSTGGYFVPAPMVNEIIRNRDLVGIAPQLARNILMGSETLTLFEETGQQTVYYPGEGGAITASDAAFEEHTLTVKKRAALTKVTPELLADAPFSAAEIVVNSMAYKFAYQLDNEFINGDGTSTYGGERGLINQLVAGQTETADTGNVSAETLDLDEFDLTVAELPGLYLAGSPVWLMSRTTWAAACLRLVGNAAEATRDIQNGLSGYTWRGYPVAFSDLMPSVGTSTVAALFGDFSRGVSIGDRGDMTLATSTDSDFANDLIAIRMTHRYDILVHDANCYAALKTASS